MFSPLRIRSTTKTIYYNINNMKLIKSTFLLMIFSLILGANVSASNLNKYFVSDVLDSNDKIIIQDQIGNGYLVEYGTGCLGMWREESKYIYIDIGGSFLDGIGDTIFINDLKDSCRVWDVNELSKYSPIASGPADPTSSCTKNNYYYIADNIKYYDERCILPYNPSLNSKFSELYTQTCQNGGTLSEEQIISVILDAGKGNTNVMSEICKENQASNQLADDLIDLAKKGYCRKMTDEEYQINVKNITENNLKVPVYLKNLYWGTENLTEPNYYYDEKCTIINNTNLNSYINRYIQATCSREATSEEIITWAQKIDENNSSTYLPFETFIDNLCVKNSNINSANNNIEVDANLTNKLKGKILLQVENHGEAWYVNPKDGKRNYMANGNEAYKIMRNFGVGITNNDLEKIKNDSKTAKKHSGKIFLQVEAHGEAYYIDFDGIAHYLKNGEAAYTIMRNLGLGITNDNLNKILAN